MKNISIFLLLFSCVSAKINNANVFIKFSNFSGKLYILLIFIRNKKLSLILLFYHEVHVSKVFFTFLLVFFLA